MLYFIQATNLRSLLQRCLRRMCIQDIGCSFVDAQIVKAKTAVVYGLFVLLCEKFGNPLTIDDFLLHNNFPKYILRIIKS